MPDVSDRIVQIYLYFVIFVNLLLMILSSVLWLAQSQRPPLPLVRVRHFLRSLFFLISGLIALYVFTARLVNNWLVLILTFVMLLLSLYATWAIEKVLSRNAARHNDIS